MQHDDDSAAPRLIGARARGRGAVSNRAGRFEAHGRAAVDDGWPGPEPDAVLPPLRTELRVERPRSAITRNASPDLGFDRSINPYRGCEHGCVYCFARPTHAFLGLSPGLDFETRIIARPGAADVLEKELRAGRYRPKLIAIGTNTDPYQPVEKTQGAMRRILKVLRDFRHPVGIVTKGSLIERDLDILAPMAAEGLVQVGVSITTLDAGLARSMEPRVPAPQRRLATVRRLAGAGVPVRAMVSPVVPGLTDHEIEAILEAAAEAGAVAASWIALRLTGEVAELFEEWLHRHLPGQAAKVLARVRGLHGGRAYDGRFGHRMTGAGPHAELIARRFEVARARLGLARDLPPLRTDLFRVPERPGDQLSLF